MDFVEAARVRGEGYFWIITREIWPNAAMPLMTDFGLRLIYVILFISSLSFLGLGVQPPQADWGSMVRENLGALSYGRHQPDCRRHLRPQRRQAVEEAVIHG